MCIGDSLDKTTVTSFGWLRKIPGELISLDEKPLLGFPPPFPWDKFSEELRTACQVKDISISLGGIEWRKAADLLSGLGEPVRGVLLSLVPIPGNLWFAIPEKGLKHISHALAALPPQNDDFIDPDFLNAYFEFISMEALSAFERCNGDKKLSPTISRMDALPTEDCLCIDVEIKCQEKTTEARLLLSQPFRKAWMQRYLLSDKLALDSKVADSLDVTIHLEAGKVDLKPSEWQRLEVGDFVLIDSCSLNPDEDKGRVMLVINGTPCFRAKIKQGSLKILEHPLYYEVDKSMTTPSNKTPSENKNSSENHENEHLNENEEEFPDEESGEEEIIEDEGGEEHEENQEEELTDEDFEIEEEDIEKSAALKVSKPAAAPEKKPAIKTAQETPPGPPLNIEEIPLHVVLEVGRIQMSIKKLLELQPGNLLELDIHPEAGVDMVVNGKRIARGELLKVGDALALRIIGLS